MSCNKKKVLILGGGVGGLSAAYGLSDYSDKYEIIILERNTELGGQARSGYNIYREEDKGYIAHSEYCWHAVETHYHNFLEILKNVDDKDKKSKIISHLKPFSRSIHIRDKSKGGANVILDNKGDDFLTNFTSIWGFSSGIRKMRRRITLMDKFRLISYYIWANIIPDRWLESYDKVLWKDFTCNLSEEAKLWIADSPAIYLGMDIDRLSAYTMLNMCRNNSKAVLPSVFYGFDGATNEVYIEPLCKYLEEKGVKILKNHKVIGAKIENNDTFNNKNIKGVFVKLPNGGSDYMEADIVINSLPVESIPNIFTSDDKLCEQYENLSKLSMQIQTQVAIFLNKRLNYDCPTIWIFADTPWFLMVKVEGSLWRNRVNPHSPLDGYLDTNEKEEKIKRTQTIDLADLDTYNNNNDHNSNNNDHNSNNNNHYNNNNDMELLSVGIGIFSRKGLNGKCAIDCTKEELIEECWNQMKLNEDFGKYVESCDGTKLEDLKIVHANIWHSFDNNNGKLSTWEPKFSNNVGTLELRPSFKQKDYTNFYNATSYVKTEVDIFNMEGGTLSGFLVANDILQLDNNGKIKYLTEVKKNYNILTNIIRYTINKIDTFLKIFLW